MPYKLNKIIFQRDFDWGSYLHIYDLSTEIEFPFAAGKLQELVPKEKSKISKYHEPKPSDTSLFSENGLGKLVQEVGPKGIYYLELRPGHKLNQLIVEPEDVFVDIYFGAEDTLIYSFYNPTRRNFISITASIEKDRNSVYSKLKSNPTDIYWRQYFVRQAMNKIGEKDVTIQMPENMTVEQVAKYLQLEKHTIQNWTSEGKIPSVKIGGAVRYPKTRIDNWLKSKEKKSRGKRATQ